MSRSDDQRIEDILEYADKIASAASVDLPNLPRSLRGN